MFSVRQSQPAPVTSQPSRAVFVHRSLHLVQYRYSIYSVEVCTSCSTDGMCSVRQSDPEPGEAQTGTCSARQSKSACATLDKAGVVLVSRSLH